MKLLLWLALALPVLAQSPGTITRTASTVTATAGNIVCKHTHPKNVHVLVSCAVGGTVRRKDDLTPEIGALNAGQGCMDDGINSVCWSVRQTAPGVWTYDIAANGTRSTGTF